MQVIVFNLIDNHLNHNLMKLFKVISLSLIFGLFLTSCGQPKTPAEKAKEKIENIKDDTKDAMKDTKESIDDAAEDIKEGATETTKKVKKDLN